MNIRRPLLLLLVPLIFSACSDRGQDECVVAPDTGGTQVEFEFVNLEDRIASISTKEELVDLFTEHPAMRDYLFNRRGYPDDSVFINTLFQRFTHPSFDSLLLETRRIFGDLTELRSQFAEAFTNIKYYYPDFQPPRVETAITGIETDLVVSDTLIIVGLDYYLGKEGAYRPRLYQYLLNRYEPEDIVPSCMLLFGISDRFNKTTLDDRTVLADMIAYGKSFYFAKHMMPCIPDSTLIWYSPKEIEGARRFEHLIWARLVEDQVLYSTSHMVNQRYLGERPKTLEVGEECPGRIAQWVGWQIVRKYMERHPNVTLPQLMDMIDAQKLFNESRYKPAG
ncbi:MAG TPA: hypothetical protein VKZ86_07415 [Cyclobacteriaceae bacterium]|nr:hypothetical protein [Cyclobacteriaceae bacterium]